MKRPHYIPAPHFFNLNHAVAVVQQAFSFGYGVFLVGSALERRDYRDVDLRCILPDEEFDRLFPNCAQAAYLHPLWSVMCAAISLLLSQHSNLPIDFQIQRATQANKEFAGQQRIAIGFFLTSSSVVQDVKQA